MAKYVDQLGITRLMELIKSAFVTDVSFDSTENQLNKTKAGTTTGVVQLSPVATSGSYNDLDDTPTIPSDVSPYDGDIKMDGTKSPGSSTLFARGDHVHPTDTSRAANTDFTGPTDRAAGTHGLVPAPPSGGQKYLLYGDGGFHGTWLTFDLATRKIAIVYNDGTDNVVLAEVAIPLADGSTWYGNPGLMSSSDAYKLTNIAAGAEVNVQSDWSQTDTDADDYIKNKPTLGTAAAKNVGSVANGNTGLVTGDAVYDAIQDALSDVAGALVYKGTAANASAISGTSYKKGWYWIASATFTLTSGINVEPGDMIIAKQDKTSTFANDIDVVQTNIDTLTTTEIEALWNAA